MEFICMSCGLKHIRTERLVDEHIHCSCGCEFYVFCDQGMTVTMPSEEIRALGTTKAFQRFVISTGRCQDVKVDPPDYTGFLRKAEPLALMEIGLERYQTETWGKCLLNGGDVASICKSLKQHQDVLVKNKGNCIEIFEIRRKVKEKENLPFSGEPIAYLNEEYQVKDWQKEIMEEDAGRSGYLLGDAG